MKKRVVMKQTGKAKRTEDWRRGERSKTCFRRRYSVVRKGEQASDEMVKDVNGQIFLDGVKVRR